MVPVPPYAIPTEVVPTIVPFRSVVSTVLGIWKSVVEPMLETENRVEVAVPAVEEPMANKVVGEPYVVVAAYMERSAYGEEVPIPTRPLFPTTRLVLVVLPIAKDGPMMPFELRESWAHGEEVPIPTKPGWLPVVVVAMSVRTGMVVVPKVVGEVVPM